MRCPNCQAEQDSNHFYCNCCGCALHQANHNQALPEINFETVVEQSIDSLKKQAHTVELEALEQIQDRATKWAKANLFILGLAASFLLLALAIFGYKEITDLKTLVASETEKVELLVADKSQQVELLVARTAQATELATREATLSLQKAQQIKQEIEQINIASIQKQLNKLKELENQLASAISKSAGIRSQLTAERENVQKLQHSFFSISLHLDAGSDERKSGLSQLLNALGDEGFQLNQANIVEIGVNQTEVLYYNMIAREQAQIIASIAQESLALKRVNTRLISMLERNPREILVKVKFP